MGMSPQEFLSAGSVDPMATSDDPEDPKLLLGIDPKRDAPMARTLKGINNGVQAPEMRWSGPLLDPETGQPTTESRFAEQKPADTVKGMSVEEFLGKKPQESSSSSAPIEILKKTGTNLLGLADMVLSVPGMVLATGADIGTRLNELIDPLARGYAPASRTEQGKKALEASSKIAEPFMNPLHKIMTAFGYGEDYTASDVSQAMGLMAKGIEKGGDWIEKKSNGVLTTQDVQSFANATMAGLGAWGTAKGLQAKIDSIGKAKPTDLPGAAKTAAEAKQMRETDYSSPQEFTADLHRAAEGEALSAVDKARNAEQQAYNLMQEGASKKKVEAIRKQNPAVGEALDRMMERRNLAIEGFRDTYQGEVIPAGEPIPPAPGSVEWNMEGAPKQLPSPQEILGRLTDQSGKADPRLLALLAATGLTAAGFAALDPADQEDAKLLGLAAALSPAASGLQSLRSALRSAPYSFKSLERLPQDRHTFTKKQVQEQIARADVPQAEKELVSYTLFQHQGETITANELISAMRQYMADWVLTPKETSTFANYGLERIGRGETEINERFAQAYEKDGQGLDALVHPTTTMYELPVEVGANNHFQNPNLFGWTRSFREGDVRHVTEIQSDWTQKQRPLTEAERHALTDAIRTNEQAAKTLTEWDPATGLRELQNRSVIAEAALRGQLDSIAQAWNMPDTVRKNLREGNLDVVVPEERLRWIESARTGTLQNWKLRNLEMQTRLKADRGDPRLEPLKRDWEARLVREELKQAANEKAQLHATLDAEQQKLNAARRTLEAAERAGVNIQRFLNTVQEPSLWPLGGDGEAYLRVMRYAPDRIAHIKKAIERSGNVVRFATPDTVAKAEGWPHTEAYRRLLHDYETHKASAENQGTAFPSIREYFEKLAAETKNELDKTPRYAPAHQSIYDRYRRVVEPLLRKAGGVDYIDHSGHTWIEVPVRPDHTQPKMFGQSGKADPRLLARMVAVGLGTTIGLWASDKDHKWMGAALGALVGAGAGMGPAKLVNTWKGLWKPDTRMRIDGLTNAWEFAQDKAAKLAWDLQRNVEKLVPDEAGRARITQWLDGNRNVQLQGAELRAATMVRAWFEGMRKSAQAAGVLNTGLDNYVTHLWDWKAGSKQSPILEAFWARMEGRGAGMGTKSPYAKERSFSTLEEGKRAGLTPLTEDISAIIGIYSNSMSRAMANKTLVEGIKQVQQPNGIKLVLPHDKAPHFYENVDGLQGVKVHPDIAPSLQFLYSKAPGSALAVGVEMLNTALKRSAVSFSLFHVKALFDAGLAGTDKPLKFLKDLPAFTSGTTDLLKQLRQQGLTPMIELAYKSGLKFGLERGARAMEDVGTDSFYAGLKGVQKSLDAAMEGLGAPVKGLAEFNHKFDTFMWDWVHTGMKLNIFTEKVESLMAASAKRHIADPAVPLLTKEQAGAIAASYTNDLLGGLNWRRLAEASSTKWGRNLALQLYSRSGRWWAQLALFAPDWTLSTTRAMTQAFGKGSGVKGLFNPTTLADLHRQYLARAGAYYFVIGNVLNQALSGHWLWENEDPTSIDMGDGRKLQWSKHTMEPVHWGTRPGQQAINKMGIIPKEALEQTLNVDYLSTKGNMRPMEGSRLEHAAKKMLPISAASSFESGAESGLLGFAGIPIHGRKKSDIAYERVLKRVEKLQRKGE